MTLAKPYKTTDCPNDECSGTLAPNPVHAPNVICGACGEAFNLGQRVYDSAVIAFDASLRTVLQQREARETRTQLENWEAWAQGHNSRAPS